MIAITIPSIDFCAPIIEKTETICTLNKIVGVQEKLQTSGSAMGKDGHLWIRALTGGCNDKIVYVVFLNPNPKIPSTENKTINLLVPPSTS